LRAARRTVDRPLIPAPGASAYAAAPGALSWRGWPFALAFYLAVYAALLVALHLHEGFGLVEPLFVLGVYGVAFGVLAWASTLGLAAHDVPVRAPAREACLVLAWLAFLAAFITWGFPAVRALSDVTAVDYVAIVVAKLVVFVVAPYALLRIAYGYRVSDFVDLRAGLRGHWRPFVVIAVALVAFQLVFGRAGRELPAVGANPGELGAAFVLALGLATLEAGLVEEFFFRALLLQRLAAWLRAPGPALVVTSLLFGLAHAPGLYLRPEMLGEDFAEPSLLLAVGYSVVVLSVAGFMFGVLWLRTRSLILVALLHGVNDAVPAMAGTVSWLRNLG
jgi:uncharacterized protein